MVLGAMGGGAAGMALGDGIYRILADTSDFDQKMGESQQNMEKTGGLMERIGVNKSQLVEKGMTVIGAKAGAAAVAGLKMGTAWQDAMRTVQVGTGASAEEMESLGASFDAVARRVPDDFGRISAVVADANTLLGATGDELEEVSFQVLTASRLLGEDAADNIHKLGQATQVWGEDAEYAARFVDDAFRVSQDFGIGMGMLLGQMQRFGPIFQNANFTMEETAVVLGQLHAGGIDLTRVAPAMNASFRSWAQQGKEPREEFERIVGRIKDAESGAIALSIATETFGAEGAQRMTNAIRQGNLELDDLSALLGDNTGRVGEFAEETDNAGDKWRTWMNRITTSVGPAFSAMAGLSEVAGPLIYSLPLIGAGLGKLGATALLSSKGVAVLTAAKSAMGVAATLALGPIGLLVGALGLLAAAFATDFMGIRGVVDDAMGHVTGAIDGFADWLAGPLGAKVKDAFEDMGVSAEDGERMMRDSAERAGVSFEEFRDKVHARMQETGESVNVAMGHIEADMLSAAGKIANDVPERMDEGMRDYVSRIESAQNPTRNAAEIVFAEIPSALDDARAAGVDIANATPGEIAQALIDNQFRVENATSQLTAAMDTELTKMQEIAEIHAFLASQELRDGLEDGRPGVRMQAEALKQEAMDRLEQITGVPAADKFVDGLISGINRGLPRARSAAAGVANTIMNTFPSSEPKDPLSPMRGITGLGGRIVDMIADDLTLRSGKLAVAAAKAVETPAQIFRTEMTAPALEAVPSPASALPVRVEGQSGETSFNFYGPIELPNATDADSFVDDLRHFAESRR